MIKGLLISLWLIMHPVHVSLLSIDYVPEMVSFDVFIKVYFDDFLLDSGLESREIENSDLSEMDSESAGLIGKYINEKVIIHVNKKQLSGRLTDIDLSDNELNMKLLFSYGKRIKTITVRNLIMTSLYEDQSNMIIVRVKGFEEGIKLTSDKTEETFRIN
ncbi:MAG TPA: DUF6702 family protein [Bacteroidales bacterium]|nr:DUF6702 family protein [Bacteroidales bacterium]